MMKVVGEDGTTTEDYIEYLKSDFLDSVYMQQNSFDDVDAAVSVERQKYTFAKVLSVLGSDFELQDKVYFQNMLHIMLNIQLQILYFFYKHQQYMVMLKIKL